MFFQGLEKQGWVLPKVGTVRNNFSPPAIARETAEGSEEERWIANEQDFSSDTIVWDLQQRKVSPVI